MRRQRCRGAAAIEAAIMLTLLVPLLVASIYFGRLALAGATLEQAASNAARYMSKVPSESLHDAARTAAALAAARTVFNETLVAANVEPLDLELWFSCDPGDCSTLGSSYVPSRVGVYGAFNFPNTDLFPYSGYGSTSYTWLEGRAEVGREK